MIRPLMEPSLDASPRETRAPRAEERGSRRTLFIAAIVTGTVIRLASLTLPGTADMSVWKLWAYGGAVENPAGLYGIGGTPTEWRVIQWERASGTVVYPPLALYELSVVGRLHRAVSGGTFPNDVGLTVLIKLLIVAMEAGMLALLVSTLRRTVGTAAARWAAVAYWLNPSMILAGSMLGYLDPLYMLPSAGALFAAGAGWPFVSGALIAAATLTKPQGVILIPAVMLALLAAGNVRAFVRQCLSFAGGGAAVTAAIVVPIALVGGFPNLALAMSRLAHHDMLSGNATNLWWIVTYVLRVVYAVGDMGTWGAITMNTRILAISRVLELGYPNPRVIGTALTIAAAAWALWTARRVRGWVMLCAVGAFLMHAYGTLAAQVHENHIYVAVPLLVIVAAARPAYRPLLWTVSAIFFLNLNLFYGISEYGYRGQYIIPRHITVIDLTVVVSVVNCLALAWHAGLFRRECAVASDARPATLAA
jgi:hypothetical protein